MWAWYAEFQPDIQIFAANGYAVLLPNPRGSSGYGQKYCQAIFADWGNKDFQDDMAMVDYAVEQGIADPDKLGVGGHSYGAMSTDFIIAQTTRFKGAISEAGEALNMTQLRPRPVPEGLRDRTRASLGESRPCGTSCLLFTV